jgi:hypothetical protein
MCACVLMLMHLCCIDDAHNLRSSQASIQITQLSRTNIRAVSTALQTVLHLHFKSRLCMHRHTGSNSPVLRRTWFHKPILLAAAGSVWASTGRIAIWQARSGHAKMLRLGVKGHQVAVAHSSRWMCENWCLHHEVSSVIGVDSRSVDAYVADMSLRQTPSAERELV